MLQQESVETNNKEVPLGYKKTKFGIFPRDWEVAGIKEIMERVRKPVEVKADEQYKQIGIRSHGKGIFHKEAVSGKELGKKAVFWVAPGCFIVNIVFAWETAVAKTTENELGYIASHRFPMYKPNENKLDLDFITYYFKSPRGKYLLNLASPGGAGRNKTLGQKEFGELKVVIPQSVKEQSKISKIISTWEKAIELKERLIELKKEQKKGLMQKLMTGEVRLPGFEGEWKEVKLGYLGECIRGVSYKPDDLYLEDNRNSIRLLRSNNINDDTLNNKDIQYVDKSKVKEKQLLKKNDLVISMANGSKRLVGKNGVFNSSYNYAYTVGAFCAIFRFNDKCSPNYAKYLFQTNKYEYYVRNLTAGSNINNLKPSDIESMKFMIPAGKNERNRIATILDQITKELKLLSEEIEFLKQQKKGLMQLLLTGKVRVQV